MTDTRTDIEKRIDHYHDRLLALQHFVEEHPEREHEIVEERKELEVLLKECAKFSNY